MRRIAFFLLLVAGFGFAQQTDPNPVPAHPEAGPSLEETQQFLRSRLLRNGIVNYTNEKGAQVVESILAVRGYQCVLAFEINNREVTPKHSIVAATRTFEVDFSIIREVHLEKVETDADPYYLIQFRGRLSEQSLIQQEAIRVSDEGERIVKALMHLQALCGGGEDLFR